jgi:hypothetical protein
MKTERFQTAVAVMMAAMAVASAVLSRQAKASAAA